MAFSVLNVYACLSCGYKGIGWVYAGVQDMTSENLGRWHFPIGF